MNAPVIVAPAVVKPADLGDPEELLRIRAFLDQHDEAQLFHLPEWSRAVETGCRQRSHYLVAETRSGKVVGVLPLTEIRSRLFGSALVSVGFGVGGGILATDGPATEALAEEAWRLARNRGCPSLELRGGPIPGGFAVEDGIYASFARPLPADEDAILNAIPRKQRAEVRKALTLGLDVSIGRDAAHLAAHYCTYSQSVRNLGTPVFPKRLFEAMLAEFGEDADVLTISKDGRAVASVLSFYFRGTVMPYWGGGTRSARVLRANELMYFELMRHAARRGCARFDFGRSKSGTGAFAYKKNWGFEPEPLVYAVRTADNRKGRELNPLDPRFRLKIALWQRMPLWAANRIGPVIARGLG